MNFVPILMHTVLVDGLLVLDNVYSTKSSGASDGWKVEF